MSIYKVGEFAKKIGISISTLQGWDGTDVLKSRRTPLIKDITLTKS